LPQRGSTVHWVTCGLETRGQPDTPLLMVLDHYPQDAGVRIATRGTTGGAVFAAAGNSGFQGQRRGQIQPKAGKPKLNFPSRFRNSLGLRQNFVPESVTGQTNIC
jgi:hypothetical protein